MFEAQKEGVGSSAVCPLCWNSCFSAGKRLQSDSWMKSSSFHFPKIFHLSSLPHNHNMNHQGKQSMHLPMWTEGHRAGDSLPDFKQL